MKIKENSLFIMIGDSVTDGDHARPIGDAKDGIGQSYVGIVDALLGSTYRDLNCRVINAGTNGHTSRDLIARWEQDVLAFSPDWVSIMIGINDIWRQFDRPLDPSWHVKIDAYEKNLIEMIEKTQPITKNIILMTPVFMEPNTLDVVRIAADAYSAVVKKLAVQYSCTFVDVQSAFDQYLKKHHPMSINADRVHPNQLGHTIIAKALLNSIDFDFYNELK
ncbi:MAG: SGNH/GDSL hydrolase family protein [Faecalibacterium sp.]